MDNMDIYHLIIPKGTLLYRKAKSNDVETTMFFSFDTFGVDTNTDRLQDAPIQVWKTNDDIQTCFFVKGILLSGRYKTSIGDYYYNKFGGDTELCIGQIKSRNNERRTEFLKWIRTNLEIESWVTPIDDISEMMEFFSFSSEISKKLDFLEYIEIDDYLNSFNKGMIKDEIPLINKKEELSYFETILFK